jgi:hypothetical protein
MVYVIAVIGYGLQVLGECLLVLLGNIILVAIVFDLLRSLLIGLYLCLFQFLCLYLPLFFDTFGIWYFLFQEVDYIPL